MNSCSGRQNECRRPQEVTRGGCPGLPGLTPRGGERANERDELYPRLSHFGGDAARANSVFATADTVPAAGLREQGERA